VGTTEETTELTNQTVTPTVANSKLGSLIKLHEGKNFWNIRQELQPSGKTKQVAAEVSIAVLGTPKVPILDNRVYFFIEIPLLENKYETPDYLGTTKPKEKPKAIHSVSEKDFCQVFGRGLFSEVNSMGKPYFQWTSAADLFWLYVGITPEILAAKMPHYVGVLAEQDRKIHNASVILKEIFTTHIGNNKVNILQDIVAIPNVTFDHIDTTSVATVVESLREQMPTHIAKQFKI
jgi:hypothetical protein